jgi:hypothetical protein
MFLICLGNNFYWVIMMFYIPFWTYLAIMVILSGTTISFRKLRFIDIQIIIMVIALTMSLDMLFCKQFQLYSYVDIRYKGWYSFWANIVITPAAGLIFIKFIPSRWRRVVLYIAAWSIAHTLIELYILKPSGIVLYPKWRIFPWSTIGYILTLTLEYAYFEFIKKHIR